MRRPRSQDTPSPSSWTSTCIKQMSTTALQDADLKNFWETHKFILAFCLKRWLSNNERTPVRSCNAQWWSWPASCCSHCSCWPRCSCCCCLTCSSSSQAQSCYSPQLPSQGRFRIALELLTIFTGGVLYKQELWTNLTGVFCTLH